ncbi:unnamed protein product [[Candida] boidinii]|uniref:Unnamed protein product n=1 Tax=Candida boidinii TaxID=5477 RepID=A0A9W6T603_CANBO|nr:hypothetical protein B5S30_g3059 [[Candida] boidinii]GME76186.1 unnamed protein product [[Candida] boidinii]GMF78881.1 unnamed protein product [[Candida] boidinii]GMG06328.1 unnamed protein product [[Candida] boidinii]
MQNNNSNNNNKLQIYKLKYNFEKRYNSRNNRIDNHDNYEYPKVNELSNIIKYGTTKKNHYFHHRHHHNNPTTKRPIPLYKQLRDMNIGDYEANVNDSNNRQKVNENYIAHKEYDIDNDEFPRVQSINTPQVESELTNGKIPKSVSSSSINLTLDLTNYNRINKINESNGNGKILGKKKYKDKSFIRRNLILILINFLKISVKLFS